MYNYAIIYNFGFHNSPITLLYIAKEAFVKQTAFNNILCTEVSSKLYSLTIMFFLANSLNTASQLLLIFIRVYRGHAHFQQLKGIGYS